MMKCTIIKASDWVEGYPDKKEVRIDTMEDLENLQVKLGGYPLIIELGEEDSKIIKVYDDYIE